jgi:VanZ family protein
LTAASFLRLWVPVIVYMAGIFYSSSLPAAPIPAGSDKPLHAIAYLGLSVVVARAVSGGWPPRLTRRTAVVVALFAFGYGVIDELHQLFVAGRTSDVRDLIANGVGVCVGTALSWAWSIIPPASRR